MKILISSFAIIVMTLLSATAQNIDLFNRSGKDIIAKEQFISFYENDFADPPKQGNEPIPMYIYNTYNLASPNGNNQYKISTGGSTPLSEYAGYAYDFFDISHAGKKLMREWGYDPLWDVRLLTMNENDRNHYIKVPLDNDCFALIFAGLIFDADDNAGEMIIVVVNQDKATVVFDRPACAFSFTPAPNFSIEFTEKIEDILDGNGYVIGAKADLNITKHKIWKEGNMLKYKSWE